MADQLTMPEPSPWVAWCAERDHPLVTYNPWMQQTWCQCGDVRLDGIHPVDWDAKKERNG